MHPPIRDEHSTAQSQQIRLLRVQVAQMHQPGTEGERSQQQRHIPGMLGIWQEPAVIGCARKRQGKVLEIHLQSIVDASTDLRIEDPATEERGMANDHRSAGNGRSGSCAERSPPAQRSAACAQDHHDDQSCEYPTVVSSTGTVPKQHGHPVTVSNAPKGPHSVLSETRPQRAPTFTGTFLVSKQAGKEKWGEGIRTRSTNW
jgi:hypothetical protein